jgi:uncharacterized protein
MKKALIIFIKNPEKGKVKTRLAATMGEEKALEIYRQMLTHTFSLAMNSCVEVFVFYSDHVPAKDEWTNNFHGRYIQEGNDLGEKMLHAFNRVSADGFEQMVIIGSDCLQLNSEILEESFLKLEEYDVVIGPAKDGGYYLLGMKNICTNLFINKSWSSPVLLEETLEDCKKQGLKFYQLVELSDIDHEKDWQEHLQNIVE